MMSLIKTLCEFLEIVMGQLLLGFIFDLLKDIESRFFKIV